MRKQQSPRAETLIFTDGSCLGNPGPGGWAAIILRSDATVKEIGAGNPRTTNNQMELYAAIAALKTLDDVKTPVRLATDSKYLVEGATKWLRGWQRSNWKTASGSDVSNQDLWREIAELMLRLPSLEWKHIPAHSGIAANERCDQIAQAFARGESPTLFQGRLEDYDLSFDLPQNLAELSIQRSAKKNRAAFYLSFAHGKLERHETWAACEARVKGVPGAKYRKAASEAEAATILTSWGLRPGK